MSPYSERSQGGRFTPADGPTAKRIEVWLDPPTLAIVDAHAKAIGLGRGKAIADLLKPTASGGAEPAVEPTASDVPPEPAARPVKAPPKAVREWIADIAIGRAEACREDAQDASLDPEDAISLRHEATAMELFAQKLRHPRQRWEFHGAVEGWLQCRLRDALGDAEVCAAEGNIKGEAKALAEAAGYRAVAAWLGIELE